MGGKNFHFLYFYKKENYIVFCLFVVCFWYLVVVVSFKVRVYILFVIYMYVCVYI